MPLYLSLKRGEGIKIGPDIVLVAVLDRTHPGRLALAITAPREVPIHKFGESSRREGEVRDMTKG